MTKTVTSTSNQAVKDIVKLRNRRARNTTGLFPVEGYRELVRALDAGITITQLWTCPALYLGPNEGDVVARSTAGDAEIVECTDAVFRKLSYRDRPEGLLAVCERFDTSLARIAPGANPLVLVVEAIEKPGNLGTMIRTAAAAGVDAVIAADPTTDVFNPNVVRSSIGTVFSVPVAVCSTVEAMAWLDERGITACASTPDADADLWSAPLHGPVAIVVGAEQYGLSDVWLDKADIRVRIPMPGGLVDSLNAAASGAILLYEAVRQRSMAV